MKDMIKAILVQFLATLPEIRNEYCSTVTNFKNTGRDAYRFHKSVLFPVFTTWLNTVADTKLAVQEIGNDNLEYDELSGWFTLYK